MRNCIKCAYWKSIGEQRGKGELEIHSGRCARTGCQTSPMFGCKEAKARRATFVKHDNL